MPIFNLASHNKEIASYHAKEADKFLKYINSALDVIHDGRPHKVYRGGALPKEFINAIAEESKRNKAFTSLVESLQFLTETNTNNTTSKIIGDEQLLGYSKRLVNLNTNDAKNDLEDLHDKNTKLSIILRSILLLAHLSGYGSNLSSRPELYNKAESRVENNSDLQTNSDTCINSGLNSQSSIFGIPQAASRKKVDIQGKNCQEVLRGMATDKTATFLKSSSIMPDNEQTINNMKTQIGPNRQKDEELMVMENMVTSEMENTPSGARYKRAMNDQLTKTPRQKDMIVNGRFKNMLDFRTKPDSLKKSILKLVDQSPASSMVLKLHLALYETIHTKAGGHFVAFSDEEENPEFGSILGVYLPDIDAVNFCNNFENLPFTLKEAVVWHELKHREMTMLANNDQEFNDDLAPSKPSQLKHWKNSEVVRTNLKINDGDIETRDDVDSSCKTYLVAMTNALERFKQNPDDEGILNFLALVKDEDFYIKGEFMEENDITDLSAKEDQQKFFCYYVFKLQDTLDTYYNTKHSIQSIENQGRTNNGECLLNVVDRLLPRYKFAGSTMDSFVKIFAPYERGGAGTLLATQAKIYGRRFMKFTVAHTNVFEFFLTLKERFNVLIAINNFDVEEEDINVYFDSATQRSNDEQQDLLYSFLILHKKCDPVIKLVTRNDIPKDNTFTMFGSVVYDFNSGTIFIIDTFFNDIENAPQSGKRKVMEDLLASVRSSIHHDIAKVYSHSTNIQSYVKDPETLKLHIINYKDTLSRCIKRLKEEIRDPRGKSMQYNNYLKPLVGSEFGGSPVSLLRFMEIELDRTENLLDKKNYALFVINLGFGESLENLSKYIGDRSTKMRDMWKHVTSLRSENKQTIQTDDFKARQVILSAFDKTKYKREQIVQIMDAIPQGQRIELAQTISSTKNFKFENPDADNYGSIKFAGFVKKSEEHHEKDEFKKRDLPSVYDQELLYQAFGASFQADGIQNIIRYLQQDERTYYLLEAIIKKKQYSDEPFFHNPSSIFILNDALYFDLDTLFNSQSPDVKRCLEVYSNLYDLRMLDASGSNNMYFNSKEDIEECAFPESGKTYDIRHQSEPYIYTNEIEHTSPKVDKDMRLNCADLAYSGIVNQPSSQTSDYFANILVQCSKNKPDAPSLLGKFEVDGKGIKVNAICKIEPNGKLKCSSGYIPPI